MRRKEIGKLQDLKLDSYNISSEIVGKRIMKFKQFMFSL